MIYYDPGIDGTQLHAMHISEGTWAGDMLTSSQRARGIALYINGIHESLCRRALQTGDFVQQIPEGRYQGVARNISPLLRSVNRLRCLSFSMAFPPLQMYQGEAGPLAASMRGATPIAELVDRAFAERLARIGLPARDWKSLLVLQPAHAPHLVW